MWKHTNETFDPFTAASIGDVETVLRFINKKISYLSKTNSSGWTILMHACVPGHFRLVKTLIDLGADVNTKDHTGCTALMLAAANGHVDILEYLIEKCSSPHVTNNRGWTALSYAANMGQLECAIFLVTHGANVNRISTDTKESILMLAVKCGHPDLVKFLLDNGADVTAVSSIGDSALTIAERSGNTAVLDSLWNNFIDTGPGNMTVPKFLDFLGLGKYTPLFQLCNYDIYSFLQLSEDDLKKIGIRIVGPRKKIMLAIEKWYELWKQRMDSIYSQFWIHCNNMKH